MFYLYMLIWVYFKYVYVWLVYNGEYGLIMDMIFLFVDYYYVYCIKELVYCWYMFKI